MAVEGETKLQNELRQNRRRRVAASGRRRCGWTQRGGRGRGGCWRSEWARKAGRGEKGRAWSARAQYDTRVKWTGSETDPQNSRIRSDGSTSCAGAGPGPRRPSREWQAGLRTAGRKGRGGRAGTTSQSANITTRRREGAHGTRERGAHAVPRRRRGARWKRSEIHFSTMRPIFGDEQSHVEPGHGLRSEGVVGWQY